MRRRTFLELSFFGFAAACSSSTTGTGASSPTGENGKPRNADQIATKLIDGRVSGLLFVDRLRGHAIGKQILAIGAIHDVLDGTSIDPLNDLSRAFITGPTATGRRGILFGEHTLTEDRIPKVLDEMVKKSELGGELMSNYPYPAVRVARRGQLGVVAFLPGNFVVGLPNDLASSVTAFAETGGLPAPEGLEVGTFASVDPSTSLQANGVPPIPASMKNLDAQLFLRSDGGASITADGASTSHEQAELDAAYMTDAFDKATSMGFGPIRMRVFQPAVFKAKDERVITNLDLSRGEVEQLIGLASAFIPR